MSALNERKVCPSLLLLQNDTPGRVFELTREVTLIGRNPDCDITLGVEAVSRRHAQIVREGDRLYIEDLDSRNYTFLDGERLKPLLPTLLNDGCQIQVCRFKLIFNNQVVRFQEDEPSDSTILGMLDASADATNNGAARPEEKLRAILEIGRDLRDTLSFKDVFERTLGTLFKIFPQAHRGFVLMRDSRGETAAMSLAPQAIRHRFATEENAAISRTVLDRVMNDGKAILSVNVASDERFLLSQSVSGGAIRTMMCVPLMDRDRTPIGILQIDTADASARFNQDDLDLLLAVAEHVGVAVDNIFLHEDLMRRGQIEQGARDA